MSGKPEKARAVAPSSHLGLIRQDATEEDLATERDALIGLFDRMRRQGIALDVETLQEARPSDVPQATPLGRVLRDQVRAVTGRAPRFEMCPGLLETRFYAERGMPAYAYGPGPLPVAHGPREFVRIDRMVECAAIYARTAATLLAPA